MLPVLGASRTDALVDRVNTIETMGSVRELMTLLA
jgi:hypothetical protein